MRVVYYQRRPSQGHFSIEGLFDCVRAHLPSDVKTEVAISRFESRGLWRRLYNVAEAIPRQGDINHITGDIHFLAFGLHKARTILTVHDFGPYYRLTGAAKEVYRALWMNGPARCTRLLVTDSDFTRREITGLLAMDNLDIRVIAPPVAEFFKPLEKEFAGAKPEILFVGTPENKNLSRAIEALRGLPCRLLVVGRLSSTQKESLAAAQIDYENFVAIPTAHLAQLYQRCDLLLFPSTYEGFGMPIIEANAVGRPVITSRVTSMPEAAADAAVLVDPLDVRSIRDAVVRVCGDGALRRDLVARGLENARRFSPDRIAGQYYSLYQEVLAE